MKVLRNTCRLIMLIATLVAAATGTTSAQTLVDLTKQMAAPAQDQFEIVRVAIEKWLSKPDYDLAIVSPTYLKDTVLADWDKLQSKYQIISVRRAEDDMSAGRVPHSFNVYWPEITSDAALAKLDKGKTLVLYCYYGSASMISWTILSLMGYCGQSLNFGMMGWNTDALVKQPWDNEADYAVDTVAHVPSETYTHPSLSSSAASVAGIVKEEAPRFVAGRGSPVILASAVKDIVDAWDEMKAKYQIVDVRSEADYKRGHIPNAINIPLSVLAKTKSLAMLDPARRVIVYSENGQTGAVGATVLNLLGYHAVDLQFGMMDWNKAYVDPSKLWDKSAGFAVEQ